MTDLQKALTTAELVWSDPQITKGRTQASSHILDGEKWIGFEATDRWDDVLDHLLFIPVRFNGYWVHWGWLRAYRRVRAWVWEQCDTDMKIVFSGHSMGGALSQIAVLDLGGRAVTTGSPKPFFGKAPDLDVLKFETEDDPVPKLPPGFKSSGISVILRPKVRGWKSHIPSAYKEFI